jgi:hypothetical protein
MNHYETESNGTLVATTPLFGSVWLALFYVLRKNFNERRLDIEPNIDDQQQIEKS